MKHVGLVCQPVTCLILLYQLQELGCSTLSDGILALVCGKLTSHELHFRGKHVGSTICILLNNLYALYRLFGFLSKVQQ
jgi:hypothetical protein